MALHGKNSIATVLSGEGNRSFNTFDPKTGQALEGSFVAATSEEVNRAVQEAQKAFEDYKHISNERRAAFLRGIAEEIESLQDLLFDRYCAESGLPKARAQGECGRTIFQLRSFADYIEKGHYVEASIDHANPDRSPAPKPDLRKMLVPLGPVVVFGASNFPLAYSTAGGDTASALAVGCPVIVKAHPMHAGTGEIIADAINRAVVKHRMPKGIFSNLNDTSFEVGQQLVKHPAVKAVGFTGSQGGGRALYDLAAQREEPIPVFSEMGSVNPVILFPGAITDEEAMESWAKTYADSIALAAGQFCTNPGLILALENPKLDDFAKRLAQNLDEKPGSPMLGSNIQSNFIAKRDKLASQTGVQSLTQNASQELGQNQASSLWMVDGAEFLKNKQLHQEVFGPSSLLVRVKNAEDLLEMIKTLEGQLTATLLADEWELINFSAHISSLKEKVGRLIFNGVPTGVEVCASMVHGGPYPATTDSRFTAVGVESVRRWLRPVAYQNWPESLLPEALWEDNPLGINRRIDGEFKCS